VIILTPYLDHECVAVYLHIPWKPVLAMMLHLLNEVYMVIMLELSKILV